MASLTIEGIPNPVTVDNSFASKTPGEQAAIVDEIRTAWASQSRSQPAATPDTSYTGALQHAGRQTTQALGSTARVLGATDLASSLDGAVSDQPNYQPATPDLIEGVRNFDLGRIGRNLPRAALENAGSIVAPLVGGAVAGLPGAAVASGALSLGQNVEERARNNNRETPSTSDYVVGGLTSLGTSALDAATSGVGRAARVNPLNPRSIPQMAGDAVTTVGRDAAGEVIQSVGEQFGQTVGTERHGPMGSVDPAQAIGEGLIGGTARGGMVAPGVATEATTSAIRSGVSHAASRDLSEDQLRSNERVMRLLEDEYATATRRGGQVPLEDVLKTARDSIYENLRAQTSELEQRGYFEGDDATATRRELRQVIDSAYRQNKTLNEGDPRTNADGVEEPIGLRVERGLRLIDANLARLPEQARNNLKDALRDLDLISQAGQKQNRTGPIANIGGRIGQALGIAGAGYAAATGSPYAAAAGFASSLGGNNLAARLGKTVGSYGDKFLGLHQPAPVMLRAGARARLKRMGIEEEGSTTDLLKNNQAILSNEDQMRRAALGREADDVSVDEFSAENRDDVAAIARRRRAREEDRAWKANGWTDPAKAEPGDAAMDVLARIQARAEAQQRMQEGKAWAKQSREAATAPDDLGTTAKEISQGLGELNRRRDALAAAQKAQAEAAERTARQGEADLQNRATQDEKLRAQQIEQAYRQRDQQAAQEPAPPRELTQDEKDAQLLQQPLPDETEAEIEAYLLAQTEARLKANQQAYEASQKPAKPSKPAKAPKTPAEPETPSAPSEPVPVTRAKAALKTSTAKKSKKTPPPEKIEETQAPTEQAPEAARPADDDEDAPLQVPINGVMRGWRAFVQEGVEQRGGRAAARDIERAVERVVEEGHLSVENAAALLLNHGKVPDADLLGRIQSSIARDQGFDLSSRGRGTVSRAQQTDYWSGIQSPARWEGAARNNQAGYERALTAFEKAADWEAVELVNRMATQGTTEFPQAARRAALDRLLATRPDVTDKARLRAYLNPLIRDAD